MQLLPRMLLTLDEIIDVSGVSRSEVYRAFNSGRLRYRRVAGRRRSTPDDVRVGLGLDS
jgi:hypothetical protein